MPFNLTKTYGELLEIAHMNERDRTRSLRAIFQRDFVDRGQLRFNGKNIHPVHNSDGEITMEVLFDHLTKKITDQVTRHRSFDIHRACRLHWVVPLIDQPASDTVLHFSVNEPVGLRTYIYDVELRYVIVLEPQRDGSSYYLLSQHELQGTDRQRDKIMKKYRKRRLPDLL